MTVHASPRSARAPRRLRPSGFSLLEVMVALALLASALMALAELSGQAIRTSHARLITGAENATSTVWKDRFLCYWFYTPNTGEDPLFVM